METLVFFLCALVFLGAYFSYGAFLEKQAKVDAKRPTPSHTNRDGVDRVPTRTAVLLGHHFSSIAGAGPIVGPIIAGLAFGWLPVLLWIVLGSIFVGGVHDFFSLMASVRHNARSIAEIARERISPLAYKIFLLFIWFTLVYVLVVFADLTADTFAKDSGAASTSILLILLAISFGICLNRLRFRLLPTTAVFLILLGAAIWAGYQFPVELSSKSWYLLLLGYCFAASILPVWILLQPRDYLTSFLLYGTTSAACLGICIGGFTFEYPAFQNWNSITLGPLFPMLFITVACGACSGFHSLVSSGTSSKQLDRESDARLIGYGSMLIEGLVGVTAVICVAMLTPLAPQASAPPPMVYSAGIGRFLATIGLPEKLGISVGLLTLSAFILTTLDTATRLARYIVEEFFELKKKSWRFFSTAATLLIPGLLVMVELKDAGGNSIPAWKVVWPIFGVSNQLLAALAFLVITVWLKKEGKRIDFALLPMLFMAVMTIWSLILLLSRHGLSLIGAGAGLLMVLAAFMLFEGACVLIRRG